MLVPDMPEELLKWMSERLQDRERLGIVEARRINHTWARQGPRMMKSSISLSIEPDSTFSIKYDNVEEYEDYVDPIRNGIVSALLLPTHGTTLNCAFRVESVVIYDDKFSFLSCNHSHFMVAKEATEILLKDNIK